ncbi:probable acyl-[acyl-carrier-protein]--UDP-N-acetylglucosamine O-acyltransferase, mitochondrial isoform X2 [Tanacetum coccineum]
MQVRRVPLRKVNQSYVIATSTRLTSLSGAIVGDNLPGKMIIGCNNVIGHHVVVGIKCQDMKYTVAGNECFLEVGDNNEIREHVSIHRSSKPYDRTVPMSNNAYH